MKMQFCPYCGTKLDEGASFCKNCGETIANNTQETSKVKQEQTLAGNPTERKIVYEGYIHKCPSCGEVLEAFTSVCPACGYEIRDVKSSSSVREFAVKLETISAQKMPAFEEKKSVMKIVLGKDFKENDEAKEALSRFEKQKNDEKASLIINYPVPNSKEDIIEFMTLAVSNIDVKRGLDDVVTKAWISKLEQVYQRAEITMQGHPDFVQIKSIYDRKQKELRSKKIKGFMMGVSLVAAWFFLLGLLWNPIATIAICIVILGLSLVGFILFKKR